MSFQPSVGICVGLSASRPRCRSVAAVSGALRNPEAAPRVFGNVLLGFALTEAVALFALVIAFMILFVF